MKILLIHQYFLRKNEGGASRFNEMTKIWAEEGHEVKVISGMMHANGTSKHKEYKGRLFKKEEYSKNIKVLRCHVSEAYNVNFSGRLWAYFSFVFSSTLGFFLKLNGKYDLVLVSSPPLFIGITGLIISKLKRIPLVFEVRDLWPESAIDIGVLTNGFLKKIAFEFEKLIYKNSTLINVLTPAFKEVLINQKSISASKILEISNGVDFIISDKILEKVERDKLRKALGWGNRFVLIYVGAHGLANNLNQVIEVAHLVKNTNALFILIGDGMEKKNLKAKAKSLNNIEFWDPIEKEKIFEFIICADAGITVFKKAEIFKTIYANKTFDYMGCQIPVLMVLDGISKVLIESSKSGLYVEPDNKQDFAEKINWLIAHPKEVREMGLNGYQFAKKNFDRCELAKAYLEKLKTLKKT
jgi:glycosyltransferase involved in cell wall biosynthesis